MDQIGLTRGSQLADFEQEQAPALHSFAPHGQPPNLYRGNRPVKAASRINVLFLTALIALSASALAQTQNLQTGGSPNAASIQALQPQDDAHPLPHSPGIDQLNQILKDNNITLDQAIHIALSINRDLAEARATYYVSQGRAQEAYAALNPTVGLILTGTRLNQEQTTTSLLGADPTTLTEPIGKRVATQNIQQQIVSLGTTLPIDISGTLNAGGNVQKYLELQERLDINRATNDIVTEVKTAFFNVLRARALRTVAEEYLKNSQVNVKDAQNKLAAQVVTKFDVLRAQVDYANAQQQLITAKNNVESLYAALNSTIGIQVSTRLHAVDTGAVQTPTATQPIPTVPAPAPSSAAQATPVMQSASSNLGPEFASDLKEALNQRPEIQEANAGIKSAQWAIKYAQRTGLPSAGIGFSYNYLPNAPGLHPYTHVWDLQAQLSVPIFDGGVTAARVKEARGDEALAQNQERNAEDTITLEVEQAYLAVQEARDRVQVANQTLGEAQQAYAIAQLRYKAAVSALIELSDAEAALTQAESNQVNALYDYNSALAALERGLGRFASYAGPLEKPKKS
ncbi:MAG TPA: TolC family protein [Fimbriimonadaceae bacterium]